MCYNPQSNQSITKKKTFVESYVVEFFVKIVEEEMENERVSSISRHLTAANVRNRPWSRLGSKGPDDVVVVSYVFT